jgi:hypothetical protein
MLMHISISSTNSRAVCCRDINHLLALAFIEGWTVLSHVCERQSKILMHCSGLVGLCGHCARDFGTKAGSGKTRFLCPPNNRRHSEN